MTDIEKEQVLAALADFKLRIDYWCDRIAGRGNMPEVRSDPIQSRLDEQCERISRMEGRLDEQSRILAALIPTRVAAVQPAAE
ncbi:hypothetical protein FZ983_02765 [Azospirillum sp. B21]|uniref:hypothetical protein n=1 Tax=Azospirillum sp. B21 TaxID=2607496 RepID=UPI0011ECD70B|nr:hypothetical protein [Azospirillum sp. B21]KAA0583549.1 hypothetical protein FZ983_02765 [Azospirillum sp. B21]